MSPNKGRKSKREDLAKISRTKKSKGDLSKPYVFVTPYGPDDGGDFGRETNRTKTGGIQEALDYAHECFRDVYIWGGRGGVHGGKGFSENVYALQETLRIPWSQDFRLDGGNQLLSYSGTRGPAVAIDSQMNCRYRFGLIVSNAPDPVVAIRPTTPGPDDFVVVTASEFEFGAPVSGSPRGTGVLLDSSDGAIINSRIFSEEINSQGIGLHLTDASGSGKWISNNSIEIMFGNLYHATGESTGLRLGDPGSARIVDNRIQMSIHAPAGAHWDEKKKGYVMPTQFTPPPTAVGARIFAQKNTLSLAFYGKRSSGTDVVFEKDAADNTISVLSLPNGYTNNAAVPTNRIVPNWPIGFDIGTPPVAESGKEVANDTPFTITAIVLNPGIVSTWTISDAKRTTLRNPKNLSIVESLTESGGLVETRTKSVSMTVEAALYPGQFIILEPGDRIRFEYSQSPSWIWKVLR